MPEAIDSLLVNLGLETDAESFKKAEGQFDSLQSKALQFGAVIGAGFGLNELTFGFSEAANEANKLAEEFEGLGVSPQLVSQMRGAFRLIDEDGSEAESTIRNIADLMENTDWGEISDAAFARGLDISGIQEAETAAEAMAALNEQMRGMDPRKAREMGQALGMSSAQIRMFRDFDIANMRGQASEFAPMTEGMSEAASEFTEGWNELSLAMDGLSNTISETFVGDLGETMSDIAEYLRDNREEIKNVYETLLPPLKGAAMGIGTLVALRSARAGLGILSKIPLVTLGAAGVGAGIFSVLNAEGGDLSEDEQKRRVREGELRSIRNRMKQIEINGVTAAEQGPYQALRERRAEVRNEINVDARGANNPAEIEAAVRRGAMTLLNRSAENTLLDLATDVE